MDVKAKIKSQFVKDLSVENPLGPGGFPPDLEKPVINANIDVKANITDNTDIYEVELSINVSALREDKNIYIIDLKYVGMFEISNLTEDIKEAYLLVECPRQLFPFARRIIFDMHSDGSLPPLLLDPINFAALYENRKKSN